MKKLAAISLLTYSLAFGAENILNIPYPKPCEAGRQVRVERFSVVIGARLLGLLMEIN